MRLFLCEILCLFLLANKTLASQPKINIEGAIERFLDGLGEYYEAGGIEAVKRSFQIDEGEVKVPRVSNNFSIKILMRIQGGLEGPKGPERFKRFDK